MLLTKTIITCTLYEKLFKILKKLFENKMYLLNYKKNI